MKDYAAGSVGGICGVITGYPLDTIKIRQQLSETRLTMADCIKDTMKNEGIGGFYKGMSSPVIGYSPGFALVFAGKQMGYKLIGNTNMSDIKKQTLAGMVGGWLSLFAFVPIEIVKIRA